MLKLVNRIIGAGLDLVFGKPDEFEYPHGTVLCPNCKRPL